MLISIQTTICGISDSFESLFPTSGQVTYALLSRPPLGSALRPYPVRLTCFMHAASVYPEPGSNSPTEMRGLAVATSSEGSPACRFLTGSPVTLHLSRCSAPLGGAQTRLSSLRRRPPSVNRAAPAVGFPVGGRAAGNRRARGDDSAHPPTRQTGRGRRDEIAIRVPFGRAPAGDEMTADGAEAAMGRRRHGRRDRVNV